MTKHLVPAEQDGGVRGPGARGLRRPLGAAGAVVIILVALNVIDIRIAHASLAAGPGGAAVLIVIARRAGLSWGELGLGAGTWRRGLAWAAASIGAVALVFTVGAALPLTRGLFHDSRYDGLGLRGALVTAFVLIPVGTVLLEEVAFRGVLWGLLRRARGPWLATAVSSAVFGLWHVLPSLGLASDNRAIGDAVGSGTSGKAASVLGVVVFTGVAGVVFCEMRRRSGSLLASAGLHWATNGLAVLAAAVWVRGSR